MRTENATLYSGEPTFTLIPGEGKALMRKSDGYIIIGETTLGYTYYIGGVKLDEPHLEVPDDYAEIDIPDEYRDDYVVPEPEIVEEEPVPVPPAVDLNELARLKTEKLKALATYDKSGIVNEFFFGDESCWLDRDTRTSLFNTMTMLQSDGETTATLWLNDTALELPIADILDLLTQVEKYAFEVNNITHTHRVNILALDTVTDVLEYDYTEGYPEKVRLQ